MNVGMVVKVWQVADSPEPEALAVPETDVVDSVAVAGNVGTAAGHQDGGTSNPHLGPDAAASRPSIVASVVSSDSAIATYQAS